MNALDHPYLLAAGAVLLLVGYLLRRWAAPHDLGSAAKDAAWDTAKKFARTRGQVSIEGDLVKRFEDVASAPTHTDKARKVAGMAARHFLAQAANVVGLVALLGGVILIAAAFFWRA